MKKGNKAPEAQNSETVVTDVTTTVNNDETTATVENTNVEVVVKTPGRPVDASSERQQRLLQMEIKRQLNGGELHRGRPVNADSARQQKLAKKDPNAKPGRPKMTAEEKAASDLRREELKKQAAAVLAEKAKQAIAEMQLEKAA